MNGPTSSALRTLRLTLASVFCAGLSVSCAWAEETIFVGTDEPAAVEVDLGVLDDLSAEPAGTPLPTESAVGYPPPPLPPEPPADRFTPLAAVPPLPEPVPASARTTDAEEMIVEDVVSEEAVTEIAVIEEPVIEEPVVEGTMTEEIAVDEPVVEETIATADTTEMAAIDLFPEDEDDPWAEIQSMLNDATEAPSIDVPAPETTVEETIVASVPETTEAATVENVQIVFAPESETLTDADAAVLDAVVSDLLADENQRIQLQAYASVQGATPSAARRLSLSRALEVRKYLIDSGVRGSRIDVRALGDKAEAAPLDRVDVVMVEQ